ncbi:hypothetical protein ADIARSV_3315 [Arcticibacter svalbardensis MN12-7]|uniref:DUF4468 domain-containing protein n=1 Tax=Arcticibacter svalbardensis MN12-7 TaxID=1150600 RepID=R9GP42_9SPHI|nr:DUF4468 domain-containing protein [Arcticibacter svalbardensis]EOR93602.1 hypothetical protein ADIARSV_3315 [Arcticibacter svalbardensis MN12-7]
MKKLLFFSLTFLLFHFAQAQDTDIPFKKKDYPLDANKKLSYSIIQEVPKASKDELYSRALSWINEAFKDQPGVIKLQDKDNGKIVIEGSTEDSYSVKTLGVLVPKKYYQNVKMEFSIKDGKYRLIMSPFQIENIAARFGGSYIPSSKRPIERYYEQIPDSYSFNTLTSLEKTQLYSSKTILIKAGRFADSTLLSVKGYMAKATVPVKKDDW